LAQIYAYVFEILLLLLPGAAKGRQKIWIAGLKKVPADERVYICTLLVLNGWLVRKWLEK
jgi:hypothetical protein